MSIRCIEVDVSRLQAKDLSDTQRENHAQMNSKVERRVGHSLQRSKHGLFVPDGTFFRGRFRSFSRNR